MRQPVAGVGYDEGAERELVEVVEGAPLAEGDLEERDWQRLEVVAERRDGLVGVPSDEGNPGTHIAVVELDIHMA